MKVPIESDEIKDEAAQAEPVNDAETAADAAAEAVEPELDPDEEAARVAEAIRRGEEAAEKELAGVGGDIAAAKKQAADASERLVRLQADWDNYRRRTAAERLAEKERAAENLVLALLPVIDDMERAIEHAGATEGDEQLTHFVEGIEAVHAKMVGVLAKEGVEVIDPVGEPFEPLSHQAVGRVEDKDAYDETVAQVYQRGYRMGQKVIRTAMVTVTFGGPKRPAPEPEGEPGADEAK